MKGWKPTDEPEFPYYYPATTTYHSKIKRSGCHQGDNHFYRNRSHASDMTQFEYHPSGGKCDISNHVIILLLECKALYKRYHVMFFSFIVLLRTKWKRC